MLALSGVDSCSRCLRSSASASVEDALLAASTLLPHYWHLQADLFSATSGLRRDVSQPTIPWQPTTTISYRETRCVGRAVRISFLVMSLAAAGSQAHH